MPNPDLIAVNARHPSDGLMDSLHRWRDADRAAAPATVIPGLRVIDAHRASVERAKSALMLHYELEPLPAFAVLVRWARQTHTPVHVLAKRLVDDPGDTDAWPVVRSRKLIPRLEDQPFEDAPSAPGPMRLRTLDSCAEQGGCRGTGHAPECPCTTLPPRGTARLRRLGIPLLVVAGMTLPLTTLALLLAFMDVDAPPAGFIGSPLVEGLCAVTLAVLLMRSLARAIFAPRPGGSG